jgi:sporulation protein YlmC with PRC-barrel domain
MDRLTAGGAIDYNSGKPMGYPGGEQTLSEDRQLPVISEDTDIFDVNGEKIGQVGEFRIDATTGRPTHITLRRGLLFKDESEVPIEVVQELHHTGVLLSISSEALQERARHEGESAA